MAEQLDKDVKVRIGNCFLVKNLEKGFGNKTRFMANTYICLHVRLKGTGEEFPLLMTENEYRKCLIPVTLEKCFLDDLKDGYFGLTYFYGHYGYIGTIATRTGGKVVVRIAKLAFERMKQRAAAHKDSVVGKSRWIDLFD